MTKVTQIYLFLRFCNDIGGPGAFWSSVLLGIPNCSRLVCGHPIQLFFFGSEAEIQGATGMQRDTETETEAEAKAEVKDVAGRVHGGKDCRPLSRTAKERAVSQKWLQ